jgi:hypothetical protein
MTTVCKMVNFSQSKCHDIGAGEMGRWLRTCTELRDGGMAVAAVATMSRLESSIVSMQSIALTLLS